MAHPPQQSWAMAPPYVYETGAGSVGCQPRSLWIGGLLNWMDEDYLCSCFTRSPELVSVAIKRSKETRQPEGFGYLNFADHVTADQILKSYNGQKMPNTDRDFRLDWVNHTAPEKPDGDNLAIYVGDLGLDVTDAMLHDVFKNHYPSVVRATVLRHGLSGRSKGYGFVFFGDVNERRQAMTEMDGAYCSTRPMRIRAATAMGFRAQGMDSDCSQINKRLFVGGLDLSMTHVDLKKAFSPYGEIIDVMVMKGKSCGFVKYASRASAEEAIRVLNGSQLGDKMIRVIWARPLPNKQDEANDEYLGHLQGSGLEDPNMHGYTVHGGYAYH